MSVCMGSSSLLVSSLRSSESKLPPLLVRTAQGMSLCPSTRGTLLWIRWTLAARSVPSAACAGAATPASKTRTIEAQVARSEDDMPAKVVGAGAGVKPYSSLRRSWVRRRFTCALSAYLGRGVALVHVHVLVHLLVHVHV